MGISKFNYEENKGLEENLEIEFDVDSFDSDESSIDTSADEDLESKDVFSLSDEDEIDFSNTDDGDYEFGDECEFNSEDDESADFFNGSSPEPLSFNDFGGTEFSGSLFDDDTFESLDNKQMKKFLSKWFKIFAGLGVCLTVLGVLLNNVLKRK